MDIKENWQEIRHIVNEAYKTTRCFSFASVNPDGTPHVTPIGSLVLYDHCLGVYSEEFPKKLPENLRQNQRICVMAVNNGFRFWLKSIIKGKFPYFPGIRLTGVVGERRIGTREEIDRWLRRVNMFKRFKGYHLLWKNMKYVREIHFDGVLPVKTGRMSSHL